METDKIIVAIGGAALALLVIIVDSINESRERHLSDWSALTYHRSTQRKTLRRIALGGITALAFACLALVLVFAMEKP